MTEIGRLAQRIIDAPYEEALEVAVVLSDLLKEQNDYRMIQYEGLLLGILIQNTGYDVQMQLHHLRNIVKSMFAYDIQGKMEMVNKARKLLRDYLERGKTPSTITVTSGTITSGLLTISPHITFGGIGGAHELGEGD